MDIFQWVLKSRKNAQKIFRRPDDAVFRVWSSFLKIKVWQPVANIDFIGSKWNLWYAHEYAHHLVEIWNWATLGKRSCDQIIRPSTPKKPDIFGIFFSVSVNLGFSDHVILSETIKGHLRSFRGQTMKKWPKKFDFSPQVFYH